MVLGEGILGMLLGGAGILNGAIREGLKEKEPFEQDSRVMRE